MLIYLMLLVVVCLYTSLLSTVSSFRCWYLEWTRNTWLVAGTWSGYWALWLERKSLISYDNFNNVLLVYFRSCFDALPSRTGTRNPSFISFTFLIYILSRSSLLICHETILHTVFKSSNNVSIFRYWIN